MKKTLRDILTQAQNNGNANLHGVCGNQGDAFELAIKDALGLSLKVSKEHTIDVRFCIDGKRLNKIEIKQNGGELRNDCRGNSYIIYAPFVDMNKSIYEQPAAYILKRSTFIDMISDPRVKILRHNKKTSKGTLIDALQTTWVYTKNEPLGNKAQHFIELAEELGIVKLSDWLASLT